MQPHRPPLQAGSQTCGSYFCNLQSSILDPIQNQNGDSCIQPSPREINSSEIYVVLGPHCEFGLLNWS